MTPWRRRLLSALIILLMLTFIGCEQTPLLERIKADGTLIVATRVDPSTYYTGADGLRGIEYELIRRFADRIGVAARFVVFESLPELLSETRSAHVHLAAAGLTVTRKRQETLMFTEPYQRIREQLVYRRGNWRPRSLDDIEAGELAVIADSSHIETLQVLQEEHPQLSWETLQLTSVSALLRAIDDGELRYTLVDSNSLAFSRRIHRYVRPAFTVGEGQPLAWAFPRNRDRSLLDEANRFIDEIEADGTLERLLERYYGHLGKLNFVDARDFKRHMADRLPVLRPYFEEAAELTGIDWRLLAAIGYQESHWRSKAVSPTGVRGIMMLTQATAKRVGVKNRSNPRESIIGGARYLRIMDKTVPQRIADDERLWFVLAGYNVGFGHLEDARVLTERQGGNPDHWMDVKKRLPLLTKSEYHKTVKYGYARGNEPVAYVDKIRNYYDLLVWYEHNPDDLIEE